MLFDSHFHLTDPQLIEQKIADSFADDNICGGVEIGANLAELPTVFQFAKMYANIYCTAGVHPMFAMDYNDKEFTDFVKKNINNPKFMAIGECGLDFHRPEFFGFADRQTNVFIRHIELANEYKKPLVVHSRDAADETIKILNEYKSKLNNGVLIHCMSYDADVAKQFLKISPDLYFAFGGAITYKKNLECMADAIRAVPLDRILIETDAPYLAPEPHRGKLNEPKFMRYTAMRIAEILNLTVGEIEKITTDNAKRFYKI
ncbi:MAG: TatD family hydrolase [Christensenellaceae bacterium]|jgi:TatD DNase family protein|nr:TatD family hydrolase [Christensenellaceae bacterium]